MLVGAREGLMMMDVGGCPGESDVLTMVGARVGLMMVDESAVDEV